MMSKRSSRGSSFDEWSSNSNSTEIYQAPTQVQEMREIFSLLDKDGDGVVTDPDLNAMLHSLGLDISSHPLKKMSSMMHTPLDFPVFLTYITSLISQLSTREDLADAFTSFDENDSGYIASDDLKNALMTTGPKRMTEEQVDAALKGFVEKTGKNKGRISYTKFLDAVMGERTRV